jgi:Mg2+/Co2+ transporter CorB
MTRSEWAVIGVALALAVLAAAGLYVRRRMASAQRRWLPRRAHAAAIVESEPPPPEPAQSSNGGRVRSVIELHDLEVSDVMCHRMNMRSINAEDPPEAIVRTVIESPHTRMPLWRGSLDNIVGVLHARDVLRALGDAGLDFTRVDAMKIARKPWFVPDTTRLDDQLNAFLRRKSHFAIVVDEYGEVRGLVTLEDIIEEIVGEIADEHDLDVQGVGQEADGSVVVDGAVAIRDLNRALGWALPEDEATTIAGLVIHETQSIPEEKQAFTFHGKRFVILNREKNRITRIRIRTAAEALPVPTPPHAPPPGG